MMSLIRNERSDRTGIPKKSRKVAPSKRNIALFLYSSTITMASPKGMNVFLEITLFWKTKSGSPYFSCTGPPFCKTITDYEL